jgi:glycosyltransferase involved in cell wall biosynthesis
VSPLAGVRFLFLLLDWDDFRRNRLALARALRDLGAGVAVMMDTSGMPEGVADGFRIIPWSVARGSLNPVTELRSLAQVVAAYRRYQPDLAHHFALKPVVYGGIAARLSRGVVYANTVTGLGMAFTSRSWKAPFLRRLILVLLRLAAGHRRARIICQNRDDLEVLSRAGAAGPDRSVVIRGSGVDLETYVPVPEPGGAPVVLYAGRMMREKGVEDFAAAARELRARGVSARFVLVGKPDPAHRSSVGEETLQAWSAAGEVEWWGARADMAAVIGAAAVVCLPSWYGEGLPKVLLEAGACGKAMVATDVPGCRELVIDGETGILVPPRDPAALAGALARVLCDPELRRVLGTNARRAAETEFGADRVVRETLAVYEELLATRSPGDGRG